MNPPPAGNQETASMRPERARRDIPHAFLLSPRLAIPGIALLAGLWAGTAFAEDRTIWNDRLTSSSAVASERASTEAFALSAAGWGRVLESLERARNGSRADERLFSSGPESLASAIAGRARAVERLARRRQWIEARGQAETLRRLSIHLVDRCRDARSHENRELLYNALRIEVLTQSLLESCGGENPGRAGHYARTLAGISRRYFSPAAAGAPVAEPPAEILDDPPPLDSSTDQASSAVPGPDAPAGPAEESPE